MLEICRALRDLRGRSREEQLLALVGIDGVYVPRFYDVSYHEDGTVAAVTPNREGVPPVVRKRIVPVLPKPFTRFLVPHVDTIHNRAPLEIMRGCTRGCRFCHAGMVTRPVRDRPLEEVVAAAEEIVRQTGFDELGLLSLSSSDYAHVGELVGPSAGPRRAQPGVSLPSLALTGERRPMDALQDNRRSGFTFAPRRPPRECATSSPSRDGRAASMARSLQSRLGDDQAVLHDRASQRDARRRAGHH